MVAVVELLEAEDRWVDDYSNVLALACFLNELSYFIDTDQMLRFFEKPWKFEDEWKGFVAWNRCGDLEERAWIEAKILGEGFEDDCDSRG